MPTPTVRTVFAPMRPTVSVAPREPAVASLITGLGGGGPDSKPSKPPVRVTISKQDIHVSLLMVQSITEGAAIVARSMLSPDGGSRCIVINLNRKHALVSKALSRADALLVRYLCAQSLSDFSVWFKDRSDGRAITRSLREICAVPKNSNSWGSSFVARLAACEALRAIDQLRIYGRKLDRSTCSTFRPICARPVTFPIGSPCFPKMLSGSLAQRTNSHEENPRRSAIRALWARPRTIKA